MTATTLGVELAFGYSFSPWNDPEGGSLASAQVQPAQVLFLLQHEAVRFQIVVAVKMDDHINALNSRVDTVPTQKEIRENNQVAP